MVLPLSSGLLPAESASKERAEQAKRISTLEGELAAAEQRCKQETAAAQKLRAAIIKEEEHRQAEARRCQEFEAALGENDEQQVDGLMCSWHSGRIRVERTPVAPSIQRPPEDAAVKNGSIRSSPACRQSTQRACRPMQALCGARGGGDKPEGTAG